LIDLNFDFVFALVVKIETNHTSFFQFAAFRQKKTIELIQKDVFQSVNRIDVFSSTRIFNSRFVNEIKYFNIDKTFEKSRFVIQTFNDQNKNLMLTQSLIIQRINQRLIICFVIVFSKMNLYFKNITQIHVQSTTFFNRDFYVNSFVELIKKLDISSNNILKMIKSLYKISKANNYWFVTYLNHHVNKLEMNLSIYDSCLFHINMNDSSLNSHSNLVQIDLKNVRKTFLSRRNVFLYSIQRTK
jgi:hypothetical protein